MGLSVNSISTGVGIKTNYGNFNYGKVEQAAKKAVEDLQNRHNVTGQFLKWVELPKEQLKRVDYIYETVNALKNQSNAKFLSVIGIGGSKHPVEHMLSINGLNLDQSVKFMSDVDSTSHNRFMNSIGGDTRNSNFLIVSKSGTTFEPQDAFIRTKNMMEDAFVKEGHSKEEAEKLASKHFVAVSDKDGSKSKLRNTADTQNWLGKLFIHDDVGGRFSAFDDHTLFTLAYAGMKKADMIKMLQGADKMSDIALSKDLKANDPLTQAAFWVQAKLEGVKNSVHQYLGSMFESTVNWHSQMQNESIKDTSKQIAKVPDAMHHSSEAHFNPANKFAFALTSPADKGILKENLNGYSNALNKSYSNAGKYFNEVVDVAELGLTPEAAGALSQSRGFSTVYQELIEKNYNKEELPEVLDSVLQPHVEKYKVNLKPGPNGEQVVVAGRTL